MCIERRKGSGGRRGSRCCVSWNEHPSQEMAPLLVSVSHGSLCLSGGLALAQVLFFYVKYLVLFGVPALLMRLDGLRPPPLPRCVSTMFSFTGMWRSVCQGPSGMSGGRSHHPFSALHSSRLWHLGFFNLTD